jgi:hypothetical protein
VERGKTTARWQRGAAIACGLLAFAAAEVADAQGRLRGDVERARGPRAGERIGAATTAAPPPPENGSTSGSGNPFPGPVISLPEGARPHRAPPGPTSPIVSPVVSQPAPESPMPSPTNVTAGAGSGTRAPPRATAAAAIAPAQALGTASSTGASSSAEAPSTGAGGSRITEIIPPADATASTAFGRESLPARPPGGADAWASPGPCVNVFVRASKVDGREVMSVDLHGDGLIKAAVPPPLAGQLLARAGPATGDARTACVPMALARHLFDPVVNLAAVDPAVRMVRVGERWVLAGSRAPEPVAKAQAPVQLAAATTRGAAKKPTKRSVRAPAKAVKPTPTQVARVHFP